MLKLSMRPLQPAVGVPVLGWGYGDDRMRDEDDGDAAEEEEWILKARSRQYPDS